MTKSGLDRQPVLVNFARPRRGCRSRTPRPLPWLRHDRNFRGNVPETPVVEPQAIHHKYLVDPVLLNGCLWIILWNICEVNVQIRQFYSQEY